MTLNAKRPLKSDVRFRSIRGARRTVASRDEDQSRERRATNRRLRVGTTSTELTRWSPHQSFRTFELGGSIGLGASIEGTTDA